jgi:hypothetical protein
MPQFIVVVREEQHFVIEAESEEAIRYRIQHVDGPPMSWQEPPETVEIHDEIVSIREDSR